MARLRHYPSFLFMLLHLYWTSENASSQGLETVENDDVNEANIGSSYFFYQEPEYPKDCMEAKYMCSSSNLSGVYVIKPDGYPKPFEVYCDNKEFSGGWTVIQRLLDSSVLLNRSWTEYKNGFGFLSRNFWIGNDKLSFLTNQNTYELRIDFTSDTGLSFYVSYSKFRISDEYSEYKLISVGEYTGSEDNITWYVCPLDRDDVIYVSSDCSRGCSCSNRQLSCDGEYFCVNNSLVCVKRQGVTSCYCNAGFTGGTANCPATPSDCQDVYDRVSTESGLYEIKPSTWQGKPFDVYCNMTNGGGWTVIQRRVNGSQNFFLPWSDYKNGFGTPNHELWLGNDKLHSLTTQKNYELRIDLVNRLGDPYYAKYTSFSISDESDNYRLSLGNYSEGDAVDRLSYSRGHYFTTQDRDNDNWSDGNCATKSLSPSCGSPCENNGAWWYADNICSQVHLNSPYGSNCLRWFSLSGDNCNLRYTEMKIRPN